MRGVNQVALAAAYADSPIVMDVREPGAQPISVNQQPKHMTELPRGQRIDLIPESGNRSPAATGFPIRADMDIISVFGDTGAWQRPGSSIVLGTRPAAEPLGSRMRAVQRCALTSSPSSSRGSFQRARARGA